MPYCRESEDNKMIRNSNPKDGNEIFHIALDETGNLQPIINVRMIWPTTKSEVELIENLLNTNEIKPVTVDDKNNQHYLLLMAGDHDYPYPSVMIWKFIETGEDKVFVDVQQSDMNIFPYVIKNYLK
jgi:hypothetical protein